MSPINSVLQNQISQHFSDPNFMAILKVLPNPDPILRRQHELHDTYIEMLYDAHIIGEVESIYDGLISYKHKISPGGDSTHDKNAFELCKSIFKKPPRENITWNDLIWEIGQAPLRGMSVIQIDWTIDNGKLLPRQLIDWKIDRIAFDAEGKLRILTKDAQTDGVKTNPKHWLLNRHMPSKAQEYGIALLSACFWPYIFKRGGYRFFVKFCEKYGLPWAIGKYEQELEDKKNTLADDLAGMLEDAIGVFRKGAEIELIEAKSSGEAPQERLINACNKEISKALTSQTLSTEIQGQGSRAASETHLEKLDRGNCSNRESVAEIFNQLFSYITELNFPPGTNPPKWVFYEETKPEDGWLKFFEGATKLVGVPRYYIYEKLQIPQPKKGEEVVRTNPAVQPPANFSGHNSGHSFASSELDEIDKDIEDSTLVPLYEKLLEYEKAGKTIEEFQSDLGQIIGDFDTSAAEQTTKQLLQYAFAKGMSNAS